MTPEERQEIGKIIIEKIRNQPSTIIGLENVIKYSALVIALAADGLDKEKSQ